MALNIGNLIEMMDKRELVSLAQRYLKVDMLPMKDIMRYLEQNWDQSGIQVFGPNSITAEMLDAEYLQPITISANWSTGTGTPTWTRIGRVVYLQGGFSKTGGGGTPAANDVMGTLPQKIFPPHNINIDVATQNSDVRGSIIITTAGNILWRTGSTIETDNTALDGISYILAK